MSESTQKPIPLISLMLFAPLCAIVPGRKKKVIHAATMEGISEKYRQSEKRRPSVVTACGLRVKIVTFGDGAVALWPPRVRGLPDVAPRCKECYEKTGRPRPRKGKAKDSK